VPLVDSLNVEGREQRFQLLQPYRQILFSTDWARACRGQESSTSENSVAVEKTSSQRSRLKIAALDLLGGKNVHKMVKFKPRSTAVE
jgi:hypothetical protein